MSPSRVALITGATGGLGLQVAKNLASQGAFEHLVLIGREHGDLRKLTKAAIAVGSCAIPIACDFSSLADVRRAASLVLERYPTIDRVLLNAAVWPAAPSSSSASSSASSPRQPDAAAAEQALVVNHLSQLLLARLLLPALRRADAGRCVFVSSELHRNTSPLPPTPSALFDAAAAAAAAPSSPPRALYAASKLLNIWSARELQRRETLSSPSSRVRFAAASPGFVPTTGLSRSAAGGGLGAWAFRTLAPWLPFAVSLQEGARRLEAALLHEPEQESGGAVYYTRGAPCAPSAAAADDAAASEAWRLTEARLTQQEGLLAPLQQ
jgi:NAD(P)-dependent dehydrogenase (short-subunit alcohol dehydrogenase family)